MPGCRARGLGLLLATALALALAAPANAAKPEGRFLVGFAQDDMSNDWRAAQVAEVERELARHPGIDFVHTDARGSTARQMLDIETLAARGIDLLITSPRNGLAMTPVIAAVHDRGIPVILLTRQIESEHYTSFIGPCDHAIGHQAADYLAWRLNGQGRVLILQGVPTATTTIGRTQGFLDGLTDFPEMEVVAILPADYLRSKAVQVMDQFLREGTAFDALYAQSDSMATGARLALRQAGIDPATIPTIGIDYITEAREAILRGDQEASFTYPTCGQEGGEAAARLLLHGERPPRRLTIESRRIDRDNAHRMPASF